MVASRSAAGLLVLLALAAACTSGGEGDVSPAAAPASTTSTSAAPTTTPAPDHGPTGVPVRNGFSDEFLYFVMPDRFENGDPANDEGGLTGGPLVTGFLPTDKGFHHGGDIAGLTARLPYLAELGVTAIWITPPFVNRYVQGNGTIEGSSSSYHGYWQVDFSRIDPHLGTDEEMITFIDAAHELDMVVIFDAVVNHTGDVIDYAESSSVYFSRSARPYVDASGVEFDPADVAGAADFPELDPATSFPHTPVFRSEDDATLKWPEWLNDPTNYHNRGNTTFNGESNIYGDFAGLDDLFTEKPEVVQGLIDIHADIIEKYGIDGYRVDTMRHVNIEFWEVFAPAILERAAEAGRPDFFFFGEVSGTDPILGSTFTNVGVPATLDFVLDTALRRYASGMGGGRGQDLVDAFDKDDWFTDADNNASMQVTFLGNHDGGRLGLTIEGANAAASDEVLVRRMQFAYDLLFAFRGTPTVYYGDEQGFVGTGGDKLARQSMFPSVTPEYIDDDNIGSDETPANDNFDTDHPVYQHIAAVAAIRDDHPTLVTGATIVHELSGPLFAASRFDRDDRVEYVVVANANGSLTVPARFGVLSPGTTFTAIGTQDAPQVTTDGDGEFFVEVPPMTAFVFRGGAPLPIPSETPAIELVRPSADGEIPSYRYRIEAEVAGGGYAEVTFAISIDGGALEIVGVDDAPPYRVYLNTVDIADGAELEVVATVDTFGSHPRSDSVITTVGDRPDIRN